MKLGDVRIRDIKEALRVEEETLEHVQRIARRQLHRLDVEEDVLQRMLDQLSHGNGTGDIARNRTRDKRRKGGMLSEAVALEDPTTITSPGTAAKLADEPVLHGAAMGDAERPTNKAPATRGRKEQRRETHMESSGRKESLRPRTRSVAQRQAAPRKNRQNVRV